MSSSAVTQTERVLYSFPAGNGSQPYGRVVFDKAGNLYGTTIEGGTANAGIVYELSAPVTFGSAWTETILYSFRGGTDGAVPWGGLVFDASGNLYGTTERGGNNGKGNACLSSNGNGCGTIFQLVPPTVPGGAWTHNVLYRFDGLHGDYPVGDNLILDGAGNLYGTTDTGGIYQHDPFGGTVFRLSPPAVSGQPWIQTVLHNFGSSNDGMNPIGKLLIDASGDLYGTTEYGGNEPSCSYGCGTVFRLSPPATKGQPWTETILRVFEETNDGNLPRGGVVFDASGNLYGTTLLGGEFSMGTVFELSPSSAGWTETTLYNFTGGDDGEVPIDGVVISQSGALYGTSSGSVFKLSPPGNNGAWIETTLHTFGGNNDGVNPWGSVILGPQGRLYGTTAGGGQSNFGTVFEVPQ